MRSKTEMYQKSIIFFSCLDGRRNCQGKDSWLQMKALDLGFVQVMLRQQRSQKLAEI